MRWLGMPVRAFKKLMPGFLLGFVIGLLVGSLTGLIVATILPGEDD
jgi:hypothetical protein